MTQWSILSSLESCPFSGSLVCIPFLGSVAISVVFYLLFSFTILCIPQEQGLLASHCFFLCVSDTRIICISVSRMRPVFIKCEWMIGMEAANREDLFAHRGRGRDRSQQIEPGAVLTLPNYFLKMLRD